MPNKLSQSVDRFNKALHRQIKVNRDKFKLIQRIVALKALEGIVEMSPVDTGRSRAAWQVTINDLPISEVSWPDTERTKEQAKAEATQKAIDEGNATILSNPNPYVITYVSNNVFYVPYLENGSSSQAPEGMVKMTLDRLVSMFS